MDERRPTAGYLDNDGDKDLSEEKSSLTDAIAHGTTIVHGTEL